MAATGRTNGGAPRDRDGEGRRVVVTGATAGLGYFAAEQLAARGAHVVLAARSEQKVQAALASIRSRVRGAVVDSVPLDLADLSSVERAATELHDGGPIDALVNNAGVLSSRSRSLTADGNEMMFGTNHLGHFVLTALLMPSLAERADARVVHLGSIGHRFARLRRDDLQSEDYGSFRAYCRSKLAVMLTGFEMAERLRDAGSPVASIVAHPGYSVDELTPRRSALVENRGIAPYRALLRTFAQGKDAGAEPIVTAALGARAVNGDYWGPGGWEQLAGSPAPVPAKPHAHDRATASWLWRESERLGGHPFEIG